MAIEHRSIVSRVALRLLMAAGVAALVAGCSDASRFSGDPFSDPTQSSASKGFDRAPTGTVAKPRSTNAAPINSKPAIAADKRLRTRHSRAAPSRHFGQRRSNHWRAEGGAPIVVAQGETASMLATRYGVPTDALLRVNGFSKRSAGAARRAPRHSGLSRDRDRGRRRAARRQSGGTARGDAARCGEAVARQGDQGGRGAGAAPPRAPPRANRISRSSPRPSSRKPMRRKPI